MKVLHISTADANGGAARGAYWMHKALRESGVDSWMLVAEKYTSDPTVIGPTGITGSEKIFRGLRQTVEYWPLKRYKNKPSGAFSPAIYPSKIVAQVEAINPDIINLHWVAGGMLRPADIPKLAGKRRRPIVWTLRDMWPFTGGCHYAGNCQAYQTVCGQCPALGSAKARDLAYQGWHNKQSALRNISLTNISLTIVPLSHWLADCARQSSLFAHQPIQVIPNAVDTAVYRPIDSAIARDLLNLPKAKKLILFGALSPTADSRKGFRYLREALHQLASHPNHAHFEIVIFGADKPNPDPGMGLPTTFLGRLHDDTTLALTYSAADVMVMPSIQDNFAKTTIEAMACGTPVVGFNSTGFKDCVVHKHNGYAATSFDAADLAKGIAWVLSEGVGDVTVDCSRQERLSKNARQTVEAKFSVTHQAKQYKRLYQQLIAA